MLAGTVLAVAPHVAAAESVNANLSVTATIAESCSLAAAPVAFGTIVQGMDADASGALTVTCTAGTSWIASASAGDGANPSERRMTGSGGQLAYALYIDSARTRPWGNGGGGTMAIKDHGTGGPQTIPLYGRIAGSKQAAAPGNYADVVTVTISY